MKICNTLFFRYVLISVMTTQSTCLFADSTRLAKIRPRSIVYLYNATDHTLKSTFGCRVKDGRSIDESAHYPQCGSAKYIESFKVNSGTLPLVAELARNRGINNGRTYIFSETINLPGAGPISLLQRLDGKIVGSDIKVGFEAPAFGIKKMWFTNEKWHRVIIPVANNDLHMHGNYFIDFCFYKKQVWSDIQSQLEHSGKWADIKKSIQGAADGAVGISMGSSAAALGAVTAGSVAIAATGVTAIGAGATAASIVAGTAGIAGVGGIASAAGTAASAAGIAAFGGVSAAGGIAAATPVVVPVVILAVLGEIVSIIPSAYDNILYKISYEPLGK